MSEKINLVPEGFNGLSNAEAERLAILIEECAEVQQIACKILRHGYKSHNPLVSPVINKRLLEQEIGDLLFAIEWLQENKDIDTANIQTACAEKKRKINKYLHYNEVK